MNINSTTSIFHSVCQAVENDIKETIQDAGNLIHGADTHIEAEAEKKIVAPVEVDTSRIVHELHVVALSTGKDITVKFDSAVGEVKRIVLNGATTVESLITQLRGLM